MESDIYIEELSTGKFAVYVRGTLIGALTPKEWLAIASRVQTLMNGL